MGRDWTKEFRDKLEDWRQPAPEGLWEAVSESLDRSGSAPSDMVSGAKVKNNRILKFTAWTVGAAAAIAALLGVFFLLPEKAARTDNMFIAQAIHPDFPERELMISSPLKDMIPEIYLPSKEAKGVSLDSGTEISDNQEISEMSESPSVKERLPEKKEQPHKAEIPEMWERDDFTATRKSYGSLKIGARLSTGSGKRNAFDGYPSVNVSAAEMTVSSFGENPSSDIMLFNRTREIRTDTKYFQPVKAGVSVKWNFSGRWGLESGLYWTGLYSRTTSGSDSYFTRIRQELHYIGIPLNLTCDIWRKNGFSIYAAAGAMLEKCAGGRARTEYIYNNVPLSQDTSHLSEKELQWSASVNVGAEYLFSKNVGLYLEPGAVWHFNNGSAIDNVYKARPLDFNISIGLRFAL